MERIRKGDQVIVIAGKDKGKQGAVLSFAADGRVVVEGVNRAKKHVKPNPMRNQVGGVIDKEMPIHASNIALFNSATKKADRVGFKTLEDGRKVRFFKSNGELLDA